MDRGHSPHDRKIEDIVEQDFLAFVDPQPTEYILDAGCGTGINLGRLHSRVNGLVGIDCISGMINRARTRITDDRLANVDLLGSDISAIALRNNVFDKILCLSVTQYLDDEACDLALKEFSRVGKDGAIIIMHIKNLSSLYLSTLYLAKRIKRLFTNDVRIDYYRSYRWYEKHLEAIGAVTLDYTSYNIFLLDFLPNRFRSWLERSERRYYRGRLFRRYGADYFIKARLMKRAMQ